MNLLLILQQQLASIRGQLVVANAFHFIILYGQNHTIKYCRPSAKVCLERNLKFENTSDRLVWCPLKLIAKTWPSRWWFAALLTGKLWFAKNGDVMMLTGKLLQINSGQPYTFHHQQTNCHSKVFPLVHSFSKQTSNMEVRVGVM